MSIDKLLRDHRGTQSFCIDPLHTAEVNLPHDIKQNIGEYFRPKFLHAQGEDEANNQLKIGNGADVRSSCARGWDAPHERAVVSG